MLIYVSCLGLIFKANLSIIEKVFVDEKCPDKKHEDFSKEESFFTLIFIAPISYFP